MHFHLRPPDAMALPTYNLRAASKHQRRYWSYSLTATGVELSKKIDAFAPFGGRTHNILQHFYKPDWLYYQSLADLRSVTTRYHFSREITVELYRKPVVISNAVFRLSIAHFLSLIHISEPTRPY